MTIFGVDVSSYQAGLDMARVASEGVSAVFVKATEGGGYQNPSYGAQISSAKSAGLVTATYHFVRTTSESDQVALIKRTVPVDQPLILDSEVDGNGEYGVTVQLVNDLRAAGYRVPLVYFPKWFWVQIGSPSLVGLPPLWSSGYPNPNSGSPSEVYSTVGDNASGWTGYGGLPVGLYQFSDKAIVAGQTVDCSAFKGTRQDLVNLLYGTTTPKEDVMFKFFVNTDTAVPGPPISWPDMLMETVVGFIPSNMNNLNAKLHEGTGELIGLAGADFAALKARDALQQGLSGKLDALTAAVQNIHPGGTATVDQATVTAAVTSAVTSAAIPAAVVTAINANVTQSLGKLGFTPTV